MAIAVAVVLGALALIHVYWALSGVSAGVAVPTRADGTLLFRPGMMASLAVAVALTIAAIAVLGNSALLPSYIPAKLCTLGTWAMAIAFGLRAIGEFRYVGFFKRERSTPFARMDTQLFSPLCALLSVSGFYLVLR